MFSWFKKWRRHNNVALQQQPVMLLVDALRSGRYVQGFGALHSVNNRGESRFCCLGVACQVAIKNGVKLYRAHGMDCVRYGDNEHEMLHGILPESVVAWFGFDSHSPEIFDAIGNQVKAIAANDHLMWNFNKIADGFERTYITHPHLLKNKV